MSFQLVACLSTYREGPLVREALASALEASPDKVYVFEGAAGPPLEDAPASEFGPLPKGVDYHTGNWRADAEKRTAITRHVQAQHDGPTWAVWIDGDEVLENGRYLRDHLQRLAWLDEERGASLDDEENLPTMGYPIAIMEPWGRLSICRAKVLRLDLVDEYVVSSSVIRTVLGGYMGEGNKPLEARDWIEPRRRDLEEEDAMYAYPPQPGVPFLVHRSNLRHPVRAGVRMSAQEAVEFERETEKRGLTVADS